MRTIDQGMCFSQDALRYAAYLEQIMRVRQRFDARGDARAAQIADLRELEMHSYAEMRGFLATHFKARFW